MCLVLLVGATLFLRSFIAAQSLSPGFDAAHVVTASMDMFPSGYTGERHREFQRRAIEAVQALPGVESAAFGSRMPLGFGGNNSTERRRRRLRAARERRDRHQLHDRRPAVLRDDGHPDPRRAANTADTDTPQSPRTHRHQRSDGAALLAGGQRARRPASDWARTSPK